MENGLNRDVEEKVLTPKKGGGMLAVTIFAVIAAIALLAVSIKFTIEARELVGTTSGGDEIYKVVNPTMATIAGVGLAVSIVGLIATFVLLMPGFKIVAPNEAIVLLFFGKYYGTIARDGFYWVNPFCTAYNPAVRGGLAMKSASGKDGKSDDSVSFEIGNKKLSLKAMTLNNDKQKVNDEEGNPIEIGVVVIWRIVNTAKAVFNVDNYMSFISTQADSAIRNVARAYPYDVSDAGDEKSLRGSSQEIADVLKADLQKRVEFAGIEILEARITHLAYAPEIAAAMLQRQQAKAIIVARQKIVEGAVGMVEMALNKLSEKSIVELDAEHKAQMVSNLLVVLCGSKDAQPVVNSGSIG